MVTELVHGQQFLSFFRSVELKKAWPKIEDRMPLE
jgi:hypothetical protein